MGAGIGEGLLPSALVKQPSLPHPLGKPRHTPNWIISSSLHPVQGFLLISTDLKHEMSSKQQPSSHSWGSLNLISGRWREKPAS
jgi:hypothetical protein